MGSSTLRTTKRCPQCGELNRPHADFCLRCGYLFGEDDSIHGHGAGGEPELLKPADQKVLRGKYRLLAKLPSPGIIESYTVLIEEKSAGILRARRQHALDSAIIKGTRGSGSFSGKAITNDVPVSSRDTVRLSRAAAADNLDPLRFEHDLLSQLRSPALPTVVDLFEDEGVECLVETMPIGTPLLRAWTDPTHPTTRKQAWLQQIFDMLCELHRLDVAFPTLQPRRVVIGLDGVARIRDVQGITRLGNLRAGAIDASFYTAPELLLNPGSADLRVDAYSFGALLHAVHLGRELGEDDFEGVGVPIPLVRGLPDVCPALVRLLARTFTAEPENRFPTHHRRLTDPTGFVALGECLSEYLRTISSVRYDIAGWSNTGILRDNNEDCFTISNLSAGAGDHRRDIALVCVADGMGGLEGGEVASATTVATVSDYLRSRGLSSALIDRMGHSDPFANVHRCSELLGEAVQEANDTVLRLAANDPHRPMMGCTLEAILLVGRQGAVCHVGDSRVYHRRGAILRTVTRDQTIVSRMIELGQLTPSEAATHPYRSALVQAVGAQPDLQPDYHFLELGDNDWILACSDGLTGHVSDAEINRTLGQADSAETAARRLVNLALSRGGSDNCTVVAIHVR